MDNDRVWCRALNRDWYEHGSTVLFDTVAVYLGFTEKYLIMEDLKLTVEADGLTAVNPSAGRFAAPPSGAISTRTTAFLVDRLIHGKVVKART